MERAREGDGVGRMWGRGAAGAGGGEGERAVAAAQAAYRRSGDWRQGPMLRAMREGAAWRDEAAAVTAIGEAQRRWKGGGQELRMVTLNHGGVAVELREAVAASAGLRQEARQPEARAMAGLVWQEDSRLYGTVGTLAGTHDMVLMQELHLQEEEMKTLVALLTGGKFAQWKVVQAPATAEDRWSGVMVWYNTEAVEVSDDREEVEGRMQRMKVRVRADGTEFGLVNVYMALAKDKQRQGYMRSRLRSITEEEQAAGRTLIVAGDMQAQSARVISARKTEGREADAWMEAFAMEFGMDSAGEVEVTYRSGEGGSETAIDHWLVGTELMDRVEVEVGAGADGLWTGVEGEEADGAVVAAAAAEGAGREGGKGRKGHNSLSMRLRLGTAAAEEAEEEEWEQRETQVAPMDEVEWEAYKGEEEEAVEAAWRAEAGDGVGRAARRLEAMEEAMKGLVKRIKELGEDGGGGDEGTMMERRHAKMLRWRKWLRVCSEHPRYPAEHRVFNTEDCARVFGDAPTKDEAFRRVVEGSEAGWARRAALRDECRRRYLAARSAYSGEVAAGAVDRDRVRTRLLKALAVAREAGGDGRWEFFRAVGRARAELAGKRTRPREGRPGMATVRRGRGEAPATGVGAVIGAVHEDSQRMHQEGGAAVAGVLRAVAEMERAGVGMVTPRAVIDVRTEEERVAEGAAAAAAAAEEAAARERWEGWRAANAGRSAVEAMEAAEAAEYARGLRTAMERIMTDAALALGMRRFRAVQGVGVGGFSGTWVANAGEATRNRYVEALRAAAADVRVAARELEAATTRRGRLEAREAIRRAAPRGWTEHYVILLPKPGKALDELAKRRDICLQPHSLKLLMNGVKPEYDAVQRGTQPAANTGFRRGGSATQSAMVAGLAREEAVGERRPWYRAYCDKGGFFQSVARRIQRAVEARSGVPPDVTSIVMALHEAQVVRYDTGKGLTPGTESEVGNGQGDTDGPTRSMEPLAIETRVVEWLVAGREFRTPKGVRRRRVTQVWFADDGAFEADSFETLQMCMTVVSVMARALGFTVGIDTDKNGEPTGDKTGWMGARWDGEKYVEVEETKEIRLVDGRRVPRVVGWYKHLGVRAEARSGWKQGRELVRARCCGMAAALARLGVLTAEEYTGAADTATLTVVAYYGAIFPLGKETCEAIDTAKRQGLARLGHAGKRAARWVVHAPPPVGVGMAITWPHAAAALVVEVHKAIGAAACSPARVAAASRMGKEYWRLGWRPTRKAPTPAGWNPWGREEGLGEEGIIEAQLKYRLEAGVEARPARGDGAGCALAAEYAMPREEDGEGMSVWEGSGRRWGWRLARLGGTLREHFYGGEERVWEEGRGWYSRGRWKTPKELGEMLGGAGGEGAGMGAGGGLTAQEKWEYGELRRQATEEEEEWMRRRTGPPARRPPAARVDRVLAAGRDERGRRTYLMQTDDGCSGWGAKPSSAGAEARLQMQTARAEQERKEKEGGDGGLREELRRAKGEAWLWLATQAPMAVGRRTTVSMVREAAEHGVATARAEQSGAAGRGEAAKEEATREAANAQEKTRASEEAERRGQGLGAEEALEAAEAAEAEERAQARAAAHEAVSAAKSAEGERQGTEAEMRAEAEWVAARARGAAGELVGEMIRWATARPEYTAARAENAEGAGAAEAMVRDTEPRSFRASARVVTFTGSDGEPGEDGKRQRTMTLEVDGAAKVEAERLGMPVPEVEEAYADPRVAWDRAGRMWTGAEEPMRREQKGRAERNREEAVRRRRELAQAAEKAAMGAGEEGARPGEAEGGQGGEGGAWEEGRAGVAACAKRRGERLREQMEEEEARRDEEAGRGERWREGEGGGDGGDEGERGGGAGGEEGTEEEAELRRAQEAAEQEARDEEVERELEDEAWQRAEQARRQMGRRLWGEAGRMAEAVEQQLTRPQQRLRAARASYQACVRMQAAAEEARGQARGLRDGQRQAREREVEDKRTRREVAMAAARLEYLAEEGRTLAGVRGAEGRRMDAELSRAEEELRDTRRRHEKEEEEEAGRARETEGRVRRTRAALETAARKEEGRGEEEEVGREGEGAGAEGGRAGDAYSAEWDAEEEAREAAGAAEAAATEARNAERRAAEAREEEGRRRGRLREARQQAMGSVAAEKSRERRDRRRREEDDKYKEVEYAEDMEERQRRAIWRSSALSACVRTRRLEQTVPEVETREGVAVGMEAAERAKIDTEATKHMAAMALAIEMRYDIDVVCAVDGSKDEVEAPGAAGSGAKASAWGSWDGREARGGALPPGTSNHIAELVAMERTLARYGEGERVLIISDCQSAMQMVDTAWKDGELGELGAMAGREGGQLVEMIVRHMIRMAGANAEGRRGLACYVWAKAHGGGVAPNAYADAAAKSHLAEAPRDVPYDEALPRACVYAVGAGGAQSGDTRGWMVAADRPLRQLVEEGLTRRERARMRKESRTSGIGEGPAEEGLDRRVLAAMLRTDVRPRGAGAGGGRGREGSGRRRRGGR